MTSAADDVAPHIPMKPLEFSVLLVLSQGADYGYGIVKRIAERDAGGIRLAPSNLYYVLDRMMGEGLVEEVDMEDPSADGVRRRFFGITPMGRRVLAEEARRLAGVVRTARQMHLVVGEEG